MPNLSSQKVKISQRELPSLENQVSVRKADTENLPLGRVANKNYDKAISQYTQEGVRFG